jgi:putative ABC transport system permease protein
VYFLTFIVKNLSRRRVRSALTVLGLAVAVGGVIALLGISHNVERSVETSFERRRIDLVVQQAGRSSGLNSDFSEYFVQEARKIPGVTIAEGVVQLIDVTRDSGYSDQVMLYGWKPDNFGYETLEFIAGRKLRPGDRRKVILGETLAGNIKKQVGDTVVFGRDDPDNPENRYEVVGVFKSPDVFEAGAAVVPIEDARDLTSVRVTGFSVRVDRTSPSSTAEVDEVRNRIESLSDPADPSVRLTARTPESFVNSLSHLQLVRAITWLVSAVGLLIGVIGMLNTMVMSVVERTQEIGILRAVGWPRSRVMRMVLGESLLLGLAAAAVGTVGAIAATYLLTLSPTVNGFIEPGVAPIVIAQGLGLTVLIGLLGGMYPAVRAARLLPTEAIRHD